MSQDDDTMNFIPVGTNRTTNTTTGPGSSSAMGTTAHSTTTTPTTAAGSVANFCEVRDLTEQDAKDFQLEFDRFNKLKIINHETKTSNLRRPNLKSAQKEKGPELQQLEPSSVWWDQFWPVETVPPEQLTDFSLLLPSLDEEESTVPADSMINWDEVKKAEIEAEEEIRKQKEADEETKRKEEKQRKKQEREKKKKEERDGSKKSGTG